MIRVLPILLLVFKIWMVVDAVRRRFGELLDAGENFVAVVRGKGRLSFSQNITDECFGRLVRKGRRREEYPPGNYRRACDCFCFSKNGLVVVGP